MHPCTHLLSNRWLCLLLCLLLGHDRPAAVVMAEVAEVQGVWADHLPRLLPPEHRSVDRCRGRESSHQSEMGACVPVRWAPSQGQGPGQPPF